MSEVNIIPAEVSDEQSLADLFLGHIADNTAYISHGELQMGVGAGDIVDGVLVARPSDDAREKWLKYIHAHITSPDEAAVFKAVADGKTVGFCVTDIEEDGDEPFGMVCDVLVDSSFRGGGTGSRLLSQAISWLRGKGIKDIYLESGVGNHSAHEFFRKRGFAHISEIFKLKN